MIIPNNYEQEIEDRRQDVIFYLREYLCEAKWFIDHFPNMCPTCLGWGYLKEDDYCKDCLGAKDTLCPWCRKEIDFLDAVEDMWECDCGWSLVYNGFPVCHYWDRLGDRRTLASVLKGVGIDEEGNWVPS